MPSAWRLSHAIERQEGPGNRRGFGNWQSSGRRVPARGSGRDWCGQGFPGCWFCNWSWREGWDQAAWMSPWRVIGSDCFRKSSQLDVLVACAGISEAKPIPETSLVDWRRVMEVNLDGAFLSVKYAGKAMQAGGAVVLVGSASGIKAAPGASAYYKRAKRAYGCWRRRRRWNSSLGRSG